MKIEFEKQFGKGVDPWYAKAERWAKKQRFPISHLALGLIAYLKKVWTNVKIENTMRDVDRQVEDIKKGWDGYTQRMPEITSTPSEVEGLDDIEIEYNKYYHGSSSQRKHYGYDTIDFCGYCDILHIEIRPLLSK